MKGKQKNLIYSLAIPLKKDSAKLILAILAAGLLAMVSFVPAVTNEVAYLGNMMAENVVPVTTLLMILMICVVLNFAVDPLSALRTAGTCYRYLVRRDKLALAAEELCKALEEPGEIFFTEHFVFCVGKGIAVSYEDILWSYDRNQANFLLPVKELLLICTSWGAEIPLVFDKKGKGATGAVGNTAEQLLKHMPELTFGFTNGNRKAYRQRVKGLKKG